MRLPSHATAFHSRTQEHAWTCMLHEAWGPLRQGVCDLSSTDAAKLI